MLTTTSLDATQLIPMGLILVALYIGLKSKRQKHPPGPRGLPLIGNLLDMPTSHEWVQYRKWSKEFKSDIIYLNICGASMVVTNTLESTVDLLEKRSSKYSGRARMPMLAELCGWGWSFALMPYGDTWRAQRRLAAKGFGGQTSVSRYNPAFTRGAHGLLRRLLETPEVWNEHLHHQAGAMMMEVSYGFEALSQNDPFIDTADKAFEAVAAVGISGAFLVDAMPFLKHVPSWFPGAGFKQKAKQWKRHADDTVNAPLEALKVNIAKGVAKPSFALRCLQDMDPNVDTAIQESVIKGSAATIVPSFLETFILAMLQNPAVQRCAHAELDSVLGPDHLPTFDDMPALPYLSAIIKECHRWQVVVPLAIPHMLTEDDEYGGWFLPSGTIVVPNSWAILNDPEVYPEPSVFNPERFLKDGKINPDVPDPELASFGYGRRVCPGRRVASSFAWLSAGYILTSFHVGKATGSDGKLIEPTGNYVAGLVRHPEAFQCKFTPRSDDTRDMISSADV
ncbi:cytochrome P450 [Athelia psychrophila]|uniref:Cytochrome P450 n=1 Tax=Athelia psychrophila TaxID=1759441 RepID=A0A166T3N6_9AGAM|nr:cytochrome P450 [Fibularhizoctonia sp. CBS 109695]